MNVPHDRQAPYRVLLVASTGVRSRGLRAMIQDEDLVRLAAEVSLMEAALDAPINLKPDAVLLAAECPAGSLRNHAAQARENWPDAGLLIFMDGLDITQDLIADLERMEVASCVLWDNIDPSRLHWLLGCTLAAGFRAFDPILVDGLATGSSGSGCCAQSVTDHERAILVQLAQGHRDLEIARVLGYHRDVVKHRVESLMRRLGLETRVQLGIWMQQEGFAVALNDSQRAVEARSIVGRR